MMSKSQKPKAAFNTEVRRFEVSPDAKEKQSPILGPGYYDPHE